MEVATARLAPRLSRRRLALPAIDVVRVVEQSLDVPLSLPGELTAFQSVAMFPRVTGFVKTVNVDRGSRVRAGEVLASLEAPELVAQRAEAQSKLQGGGSAAVGGACEG